MIEVTQIRKSYGKKKVLSDITFQVKPGECVAIAGKNGCGKSTLMQIMAGILKPDGGELCYFGKKAAYKSSTFRRFCGYVPQENPLMEELTVQDNLKLWGGSHNANTKELVAQFQLEDTVKFTYDSDSGDITMEAKYDEESYNFAGNLAVDKNSMVITIDDLGSASEDVSGSITWKKGAQFEEVSGDTFDLGNATEEEWQDLLHEIFAAMLGGF